MGKSEMTSCMSHAYSRYSLQVARLASWLVAVLRRGLRQAFESNWMYDDIYGVGMYMDLESPYN